MNTPRSPLPTRRTPLRIAADMEAYRTCARVGVPRGPSDPRLRTSRMPARFPGLIWATPGVATCALGLQPAVEPVEGFLLHLGFGARGLEVSGTGSASKPGGLPADGGDLRPASLRYSPSGPTICRLAKRLAGDPQTHPGRSRTVLQNVAAGAGARPRRPCRCFPPSRPTA